MSKRNTDEFGRISTAAFGFLKSHDLGRLNPALSYGYAYFDKQGNIMDTQLEHPGSFPLQAYFNNLAATELNPVSKQMMSITTLYNLLLIYLYQHNTIAMADENKGKSIDKWNTNRFAATKDFQDVFFNPNITMSNMSRDDVSTIATAHIVGYDRKTKQPYKFSDLDIQLMDIFRDITGQVLNDNAKNYQVRKYIPSSLGKVALFGETKEARALYEKLSKQLTADEVGKINRNVKNKIMSASNVRDDYINPLDAWNPGDDKIKFSDLFKINKDLDFYMKFFEIGLAFILTYKGIGEEFIDNIYNVYYNDGYNQNGPLELKTTWHYNDLRTVEFNNKEINPSRSGRFLTDMINDIYK